MSNFSNKKKDHFLRVLLQTIHKNIMIKYLIKIEITNNHNQNDVTDVFKYNLRRLNNIKLNQIHKFL